MNVNIIVNRFNFIIFRQVDKIRDHIVMVTIISKLFRYFGIFFLKLPKLLLPENPHLQICLSCQGDGPFQSAHEPFAANELLGLGHDERHLGLVAHVCEVENLTGLGDVAGQFHGGYLVKLAPGDPLAAVSLPVPEQDIYYRYFGPIHTKEVIGSPEQRKRINAAADAALGALAVLHERQVSEFAAYTAVAKQFAIDSDLLRDPRVIDAIAAAERAGGAASMIMLGNAVFSTVPFEGSIATRLSSRAGGSID